jgi:hypothetical protein
MCNRPNDKAAGRLVTGSYQKGVREEWRGPCVVKPCKCGANLVIRHVQNSVWQKVEKEK